MRNIDNPGFAARRRERDDGSGGTAVAWIVGGLLVAGALLLIGVLVLGVVFLMFGAFWIAAAPPPPIIVEQPAMPIAPPPPLPPPPVAVPNQAPDATAQKFIAQNLGANDRAGALAANSPFWAKLRAAVAQRRFRQGKLVGGGFGQVPFEDTLAGGGVLVGFFAGEDNGGHVGYLQPIYLTAQGEKAGPPYGVLMQRPLQCFKAKPGYAVGGFHARTGGVIDAFAVVFMKVDGERLNPADNYTSPWIGGQGGGLGMFTSTGELAIGIYGRRLNHEVFAPAGAPTGLGLLLLP